MPYMLHAFSQDIHLIDQAPPLPVAPDHIHAPQPRALTTADPPRQHARSWSLSNAPRPSSVMRPLPPAQPQPPLHSPPDKTAAPLLVPMTPPQRSRRRFMPVAHSSHTQHVGPRAPRARADPGTSSNSLRRKLLGKRRLRHAQQPGRAPLAVRHHPASGSQHSHGDSAAPRSRGRSGEHTRAAPRGASRGARKQRTPRHADSGPTVSGGPGPAQFDGTHGSMREVRPEGPEQPASSPARPAEQQSRGPAPAGPAPAGNAAQQGRGSSSGRAAGSGGKAGGDAGAGGGGGGGGSGSDAASHASGDEPGGPVRCSICNAQVSGSQKMAACPQEAPLVCTRCGEFVAACQSAGVTKQRVVEIFAADRRLLQLPAEQCYREICQINAVQVSGGRAHAPSAMTAGVNAAAAGGTRPQGSRIADAPAAECAGTRPPQARRGPGRSGGHGGDPGRGPRAAAGPVREDVAAAIMSMRAKVPPDGDSRGCTAGGAAGSPVPAGGKGSGGGVARARESVLAPQAQVRVKVEPALDPANFRTNGQCVICRQMRRLCVQEPVFCACEVCAALWHQCMAHGFTFREVQRAYAAIGARSLESFMKHALSLKTRGLLVEGISAAGIEIPSDSGEPARGAATPQAQVGPAPASAPAAQPATQEQIRLDAALQQAARSLLDTAQPAAALPAPQGAQPVLQSAALQVVQLAAQLTAQLAGEPAAQLTAQRMVLQALAQLQQPQAAASGGLPQSQASQPGRSLPEAAASTSHTQAQEMLALQQHFFAQQQQVEQQAAAREAAEERARQELKRRLVRHVEAPRQQQSQEQAQLVQAFRKSLAASATPGQQQQLVVRSPPRGSLLATAPVSPSCTLRHACQSVENARAADMRVRALRLQRRLDAYIALPVPHTPPSPVVSCLTVDNTWSSLQGAQHAGSASPTASRPHHGQSISDVLRELREREHPTATVPLINTGGRNTASPVRSHEAPPRSPHPSPSPLAPAQRAVYPGTSARAAAARPQHSPSRAAAAQPRTPTAVEAAAATLAARASASAVSEPTHPPPQGAGMHGAPTRSAAPQVPPQTAALTSATSPPFQGAPGDPARATARSAPALPDTSAVRSASATPRSAAASPTPLESQLHMAAASSSMLQQHMRSASPAAPQAGQAGVPIADAPSAGQGPGPGKGASSAVVKLEVSDAPSAAARVRDLSPAAATAAVAPTRAAHAGAQTSPATGVVRANPPCLRPCLSSTDVAIACVAVTLDGVNRVVHGSSAL